MGLRVTRVLLEGVILCLVLASLCVSLWTCVSCLSFRRKGEADIWRTQRLPEHLPIASDTQTVRSRLPIRVANATKVTRNAAQVAPKVIKYLFVQQFPEHLGHAPDSIRALLALGKAVNRTVVAPVVQHARLFGAANALAEAERPLQHYFDEHHLNSTMDKAGMKRFASIDEMRETCGLGWDVVVLFRARDLEKEVWGTAAADMLRAVDSEAEQRLVNSEAVAPCPTLAGYVQSFPDKYLGYRRPPVVRETLCVEGERVPSVEHLENLVFKKRPCVNLLLWARAEKTRLPLRPHINVPAFQSFTLKHNRAFLQQAENVQHHYLGLNYIGIHVGLLALLRQYGTDYASRLAQSSKLVVNTVNQLRRWKRDLQTFLVTDLDDVGLLDDNSTTLANVTDLVEAGQRKLESLRQAVFATQVGYPSAYSDYASMSLIKANVLKYSDYLITVGGGSYQEWIVESFRKQHPEYLYHEQILWRLDVAS